MPTIIGTITFLICSSVLAYRNFYSEKVRKDINDGKKVNTTSISIITILLPFVLGRLSLEIKTPLSIADITSIGTLIAAIIAYLEYKSKVANKVNEKQLDKIIELTELLEKEFFTLKKINEDPEQIALGNREKSEGQNLIDIAKANYLNRLNENFYLEINENFLQIAKKFSKYYRNILIPKEISEKIKPFKYDNILNIEEKIKVIPSIKTKNQSLLLKDEGENTRDDTETWQSSGTVLRNEKEANKLTEPTIQAYNNIEIFQKSCDELIVSIQKWLKDNDVKGVNLPDLDNPQSQDN